MEIRKLAKTICNFSMLPGILLNLDNGNLEIISSGTVNEAVFSVITKQLLFKVAQENRHRQAFRFVHSTELSFLFFYADSNLVLVFGPFYIRSRENNLLIEAIETACSTKLSASKKVMISDSIRVKDNFFTDAWKEIMCTILGIKDFKLDEVRSAANINYEQIIAEIDESRMIGTEISSVYEFEQKICEAIRRGDKEKLYELLIPKKDLSLYAAEVGSNISYRFESHRYRSRKNSQIILNTIFRLTAEQIGLPPLYLHSISDSIARAIEQSEENGIEAEVVKKMINSYCDAINNIAIGNKSYRVTRVQKYIITNLTNELSLEKLASVADTSPQHLSRQFKKECGITITQYIRTQKVNEAKQLLRTSDATIAEIADSLGFSSQNYFCNIFKTETGMTPSEFKNKSELTKNRAD